MSTPKGYDWCGAVTAMAKLVAPKESDVLTEDDVLITKEEPMMIVRTIHNVHDNPSLERMRRRRVSTGFIVAAQSCDDPDVTTYLLTMAERYEQDGEVTFEDKASTLVKVRDYYNRCELHMEEGFQ
jgi:hypothetical protein